MNDALPRADFVRRLVAWLIDLILMLFLTLVLVMLFDVMEDAEDYQSSAWIGWVLLLAVVSWLIVSGPRRRRRPTIGKALLRIRTATRDGTRG